METKNYQAGMESIYAMSRGPKDQLLISTATGIYLATYDAKLDVFESRLRRINDLQYCKLSNVFEDKVIIIDNKDFIAQLDTKTCSLSEKINWRVKKLVHLTNDILLVLSSSNLRLVIFGR